MDKVNVGVCGLGRIGAKHCRCFAHDRAHCALAAVCDLDRAGIVAGANGSFLKRKVGAAVIAVRRGGTRQNHWFMGSQTMVRVVVRPRDDHIGPAGLHVSSGCNQPCRVSRLHLLCPG